MGQGGPGGLERNTAKSGGYDVLVVGYHTHSAIFGRIMGSTAQSVRLAPCPVLLAKLGPAMPPARECCRLL